jgi:hypothetical protein
MSDTSLPVIGHCVLDPNHPDGYVLFDAEIEALAYADYSLGCTVVPVVDTTSIVGDIDG